MSFRSHNVKILVFTLGSFVTLVLAGAISCSSKSSSKGEVCCTTEGSIKTEDVYASPTITTIQFEVDYMAGMEPQAGETLTGTPHWNFFENNISALFKGTKTLVVPKTLADMDEVPAGGKNYSVDEIRDLAAVHRNAHLSGADVLGIYILYLDGYYIEDGVENKAVLGVSVGSTGIVAIFKPAILDNTFSSDRLRSFTEQSVLIHEAGHTFGLVNNGLALQSSHQDEPHGAHCTNTECIMYWANEGAKDLIQFLARNGADIEAVVFGQECLDDAYAQL